MNMLFNLLDNAVVSLFEWRMNEFCVYQYSRYLSLKFNTKYKNSLNKRYLITVGNNVTQQNTFLQQVVLTLPLVQGKRWLNNRKCSGLLNLNLSKYYLCFLLNFYIRNIPFSHIDAWRLFLFLFRNEIDSVLIKANACAVVKGKHASSYNNNAANQIHIWYWRFIWSIGWYDPHDAIMHWRVD